MARKTSRTILIILLVVSALIGMSAIGISYYYSQIDDVTPTDTNADDTVPSCNRIYLIDEANGIELDSTVTVNDIALDPNSTVLIGAEFQAPTAQVDPTFTPYSDFRFTINTETFDVLEGDYQVTENGDINFYFPEFDFSEFGDADTLTIQATAINAGEPMTGITECQPLIADVDQEVIPQPEPGACIEEGDSSNEITDQCCTGLTAISCDLPDPDDVTQCMAGGPENCFVCVPVGEDGESPDDGICGTGENLCNSPNDCADDDPPVVEPTCVELGQEGTTTGTDYPTCCEGLEAISCSEPDQDDNQCNEQQDCFICIESDDDDVCGTGENSCNSPNDCPAQDPGDDDGDPGDDDGDPSEPSEGDLSDFTVSVSGPSCFERVSPNNIGEFRIIITNNADDYQDVNSITGSAPLGYTYVAGSTLINGTTDLTDQYIEVTNVGSSQQLTWSTPGGWSVSPGGSMIVEFTLIAGSSALTGENVQMEVVVTPANVAVNPSALRSEYTYTTAQSCSTPGTGLFDTTISKIIAGGIVMMISLLFYISNFGHTVSENLAGTKAARKAELLGLRLTSPREYFEEKFKDISDKKKK